MTRRGDLFDDSWSPLKVGFWHQQHHWTALAAGLGADEAEALRFEYTLVQAGHSDVLGRPCLCGSIEKFPGAVRGGMHGAHDSLGSLVSLRADLEQSADTLPLRWQETRRMFVVQGRGEPWRTRMGLCVTGRKYRSEDFMADLGRQHAWSWAAWTLGWRGTCRWPRQGQPAGRIAELRAVA